MPRVLTHLAWIVLMVAAPAAAQSPPETTVGRGGLADLSADDVAALRGARDRLKEMILDAEQPQPARRQEIEALARVHEALADWGAENQADWYFQIMTTFDNEALRGLLAEIAEASAKGDAYHVAGVRAFWKRVDAALGDDLPAHLRNARNRFTRMVRQWEKPPPLTAGLQVLKTPIRPIDPPRMVAPLKAAPFPLDLSKAVAPQKLAPRPIDLSKTLAPYPPEATKAK